jgi:lipopolysaccharide export system protein LptC
MIGNEPVRETAAELRRAHIAAATAPTAPPSTSPTSPTSLPPAPRAGARYTRFVSSMKLLLPGFAVAVIVLVVAWPQLQKKPEGFRLGLSNITVHGRSGQQVVNARFTGNDADDRPFTVTSESALQRKGGSDIFELEFPKADISMSNGSWIALAADAGAYHKSNQILELSGGVNLFHDSGYEFRTRKAEIDLGNGAAHGNDPVSGQGPFGTLAASGFEILERGNRIIFSGKATLLLYPGLEKKSK